MQMKVDSERMSDEGDPLDKSTNVKSTSGHGSSDPGSSKSERDNDGGALKPRPDHQVRLSRPKGTSGEQVII